MGVTKRPPFVVISVLAISRKITSLEAAIVSSAEARGKVLMSSFSASEVTFWDQILMRPNQVISVPSMAEPSVGVVNPRRGKVLMSIVRVLGSSHIDFTPDIRHGPRPGPVAER